jgi:hypothetical protein
MLNRAPCLSFLYLVSIFQGTIPAISYSSSDDDDEDFYDAEVRKVTKILNANNCV